MKTLSVVGQQHKVTPLVTTRGATGTSTSTTTTTSTGTRTETIGTRTEVAIGVAIKDTKAIPYKPSQYERVPLTSTASLLSSLSSKIQVTSARNSKLTCMLGKYGCVVYVCVCAVPRSPLAVADILIKNRHPYPSSNTLSYLDIDLDLDLNIN